MTVQKYRRSEEVTCSLHVMYDMYVMHDTYDMYVMYDTPESGPNTNPESKPGLYLGQGQVITHGLMMILMHSMF